MTNYPTDIERKKIQSYKINLSIPELINLHLNLLWESALHQSFKNILIILLFCALIMGLGVIGNIESYSLYPHKQYIFRVQSSTIMLLMSILSLIYSSIYQNYLKIVIDLKRAYKSQVNTLSDVLKLIAVSILFKMLIVGLLINMAKLTDYCDRMNQLDMLIPPEKHYDSFIGKNNLKPLKNSTKAHNLFKLGLLDKYQRRRGVVHCLTDEWRVLKWVHSYLILSVLHILFLKCLLRNTIFKYKGLIYRHSYGRIFTENRYGDWSFNFNYSIKMNFPDIDNSSIDRLYDWADDIVPKLYIIFRLIANISDIREIISRLSGKSCRKTLYDLKGDTLSYLAEASKVGVPHQVEEYKQVLQPFNPAYKLLKNQQTVQNLRQNPIILNRLVDFMVDSRYPHSSNLTNQRIERLSNSSDITLSKITGSCSISDRNSIQATLDQDDGMLLIQALHNRSHAFDPATRKTAKNKGFQTLNSKTSFLKTVKYGLYHDFFNSDLTRKIASPLTFQIGKLIRLTLPKLNNTFFYMYSTLMLVTLSQVYDAYTYFDFIWTVHAIKQLPVRMPFGPNFMRPLFLLSLCMKSDDILVKLFKYINMSWKVLSSMYDKNSIQTHSPEFLFEEAKAKIPSKQTIELDYINELLFIRNLYKQCIIFGINQKYSLTQKAMLISAIAEVVLAVLLMIHCKLIDQTMKDLLNYIVLFCILIVPEIMKGAEFFSGFIGNNTVLSGSFEDYSLMQKFGIMSMDKCFGLWKMGEDLRNLLNGSGVNVAQDGLDSFGSTRFGFRELFQNRWTRFITEYGSRSPSMLTRVESDLVRISCVSPVLLDQFNGLVIRSSSNMLVNSAPLQLFCGPLVRVCEWIYSPLINHYQDDRLICLRLENIINFSDYIEAGLENDKTIYYNDSYFMAHRFSKFAYYLSIIKSKSVNGVHIR